MWPTKEIFDFFDFFLSFARDHLNLKYKLLTHTEDYSLFFYQRSSFFVLWPSWVKFWNTSNQLDHTRCESFIHLKRTNDLPHAFIRVNFTVHSQFTLKYLILLHYHPVDFSFYLLLVHPTTFNFYSVRDSFNLLYSYFFSIFSTLHICCFFFQFHLVELVLFIYGTLPMIYFVTLLHYAAV